MIKARASMVSSMPALARDFICTAAQAEAAVAAQRQRVRQQLQFPPASSTHDVGVQTLFDKVDEAVVIERLRAWRAVHRLAAQIAFARLWE